MSPLRVMFLVNGPFGSAGGERARRIAAELGPEDVRLVYRRGSRATDLRRFIASCRGRGAVVYAVDLAVVPVVAGALAATANSFVIDTGDAPADFLRLTSAGRLRTTAADVMERAGYGRADSVVVRGQQHEQVLRDRGVRSVHVIPDGVDLDIVRPLEDVDLRRRLGLADVFTVGIAGFFTWFDSLGGGPGSELLRAVATRPEVPLHAVLIGDGPGLPHLRILAHRLGVSERLHILGRAPYADLGRYLGLCDACVLTLTNDPSSQVRTTGKLPVYLAAGRYIVASRVGTASELLPEGMLLDYYGGWDPSYPQRLADRLVEVAADRHRRERGLALRALAARFEYGRVARAGAAVIREVGARHS